MLTAIAIDDEPDALDLIGMHASKVPFLDLQGTFTNAFAALDHLQKHRVDLLFLDIKMPDISGIELVSCLPFSPMIIFTTAYSQYAVDGFELSALDYLLKPFSLARFTKACNKAMENKLVREKDPPTSIFIKTGYEEERVQLSDILYIEADGNYLSFVLSDRTLLTRQSMNEVMTLLPARDFVRIHRSFIIPLARIEKIARQEITVAGKNIPVGVSYEEKVAELRRSL